MNDFRKNVTCTNSNLLPAATFSLQTSKNFEDYSLNLDIIETVFEMKKYPSFRFVDHSDTS